jgi:hypothetical protein
MLHASPRNDHDQPAIASPENLPYGLIGSQFKPWYATLTAYQIPLKNLPVLPD